MYVHKGSVNYTVSSRISNNHENLVNIISTGGGFACRKMILTLDWVYWLMEGSGTYGASRVVWGYL